jgi:hypothetical protein
MKELLLCAIKAASSFYLLISLEAFMYRKTHVPEIISDLMVCC